jgi:hypothetical protein
MAKMIQLCLQVDVFLMINYFVNDYDLEDVILLYLF